MLTRSGAATGETDPVATVPSSFSYLKKMFGVLAPDSPQVSGNIAIKTKSAANDNVIWVGDENDNGDSGVYGSDVDAATLPDGSSVVAWIGPDRVVHAKYYPAEGDGKGASDEDIAARAEHTGQINDLLADLGGAGQRAGNADGRVKVTAYGQGGVAALWIADFGFTAALMGKLYMMQQDPGGGTEADSQSAQSASWTIKDISPVAVPRHASDIAINISEDGQISVSYRSEPGDGGSMFSVPVGDAIARGDSGDDELSGSDAGDLLAPGPEASGFQAPHGSSAPVKLQNAAASDGDEKDAAAGQDAAGPAGDGQGTADEQTGGGIDASLVPILPDVTGEVELGGTPVTVAGGAGDTVQQSQPQVVVAGNGNPVVLHVEPGAENGTAVIKITPLGSDGHPIVDANGNPAVTIVSDHAVVADEEKPYLELDPTIAAVGEGVGVAFVTESGEGEQSVYQLNVQVFDGQGGAICDTPAVVALAGDHETTYSDFDVGGIGGGGPSQDDDAGGSSGSHDGGQDSSAGVQVAVVWVENANESGYGTIMGQRFGVAESDDDSASSDSNSGHSGDAGSGFVLVALGRDGSGDTGGGDGDAAFNMPSGDTGEVIGRAPQVSGCGDKGIAVAWVQETSAGSGVEVIEGAVLQASNGSSLLAINLTGLIGNGIVHGTEPALLTDGNGDIVIGWIQAGGGGQYEAAVAVYRALATGGWTVPDAAHVLRTFDSVPQNLDFGLQGGGDPTILLSWSNDRGRVSGAYFDLDGTQEGNVFRIRGDNDSLGANDGDLSVAGLSDGHIVVVYTLTDGHDTDIGALIVQTAPGSMSEPSGASVEYSASDLIVSAPAPSDLDASSGSSSVATIVTTPSQADGDNYGSNSGSGSNSGISRESGTATGLVVADLDSDLIRVFESVESYNSKLSGSNRGSQPSNSGSSSTDSRSGSGNHASQVDDHRDDDQLDDRSASDSSGSGASGSGKDGGYDNLAFSVGYGNDVEDYYEDDHVFDVAEPVADMFDALQFANALHDNGNGEVLVFDASNLVVIRDFETL